MRIETYHSQALSDCGGESCRVGVYDTTWGESILVLLGEVEEPIIVVWQQLHSVKVGVCHLELSNEVWVDIGINSQGYRGNDSGNGE